MYTMYTRVIGLSVCLVPLLLAVAGCGDDDDAPPDMSCAPGLQSKPTGDPKTWLLDQFGRFEARPAAWAATPISTDIAAKLVDERQMLQPALAVRRAQNGQAGPN